VGEWRKKTKSISDKKGSLSSLPLFFLRHEEDEKMNEVREWVQILKRGVEGQVG